MNSPEFESWKRLDIIFIFKVIQTGCDVEHTSSLLGTGVLLQSSVS
jgi:hypothetical protein